MFMGHNHAGRQSPKYKEIKSIITKKRFFSLRLHGSKESGSLARVESWGRPRVAEGLRSKSGNERPGKDMQGPERRSGSLSAGRVPGRKDRPEPCRGQASPWSREPYQESGFLSKCIKDLKGFK